MSQLTLESTPAPTASTAVPRSLRFLVVDDDAEGRFLIAKTLLRKFPTASIVECGSAGSAFEVAQSGKLSLVVSHRTFDCDGAALVREIRRRAPRVPIVMVVPAADRQRQASASGADAFLTRDEWLMVGSRVLELLGQGAAEPTAALAS